jgi:MFS family permease
VNARQRRLLAVLGITFLLNQYDMVLIGLALPQIQAGLGVAEEDVGGLVGAVRLGAVAALLFALAADRVGRRRMLLVTILGFTLCTTLTAFSKTPTQFVALQFCARACIAAEEVLAIVVIAEEFAAGARGWGLGILALFGALGHGLAAIAFGFVETLPFGWRALYLVGVVPLLILAWIRRGIRETPRFEAERAGRQDTGAVLAFQPLRDLVAMYPGRMSALAVATLGFGFVTATALSFVSKTLQEVHGFSPPEVTTLFLAGGLLAIAANPAAGILSDRFGRRRVLIVGLLTNAICVVCFYNTAGAVVVLAWILLEFTFMGCDVLFGALGSELFPTSYRSTASAVRMMTLAAGAGIGLYFEGLLFGWTGSHSVSITWMITAGAIAPLAIALWIPETAARELEEIAPARSAARVGRKGETPPKGEV